MDEATYRRLMGCWATGVSILTSVGSRGLSGCTANALTSLSLRPPLLVVCLDETARTLEAIRWSQRFAINILAAGQEDLSLRFASKSSMEEKFAGVQFHLEHGAPVFDSCMAHVVCELVRELEGGDHIIAVARPVAGAIDDVLAPLLFVGGAYWDATPQTARSYDDAVLPAESVGWDVEQLAEALSLAALTRA